MPTTSVDIDLELLLDEETEDNDIIHAACPNDEDHVICGDDVEMIGPMLPGWMLATCEQCQLMEARAMFVLVRCKVCGKEI